MMNMMVNDDILVYIYSIDAWRIKFIMNTIKTVLNQ